ncbi:MAG TPA: hypothetical protein PKC24_08770 [Cyclobacteriaceae bacterium]|nr:hypothetical protein [Cyclobacteriaceae bacterium]
MKTTTIREKLTDYIRSADEKKVKAIYTMLESEIAQEDDIWTDKFLNELNKRTSDYESGKVNVKSWKEVKKHARKSANLKA